MLAMIELNKIEPNPWQPRKEFTEEDLKGLGDSIKQEGLKQAIGLRRHPDKKGMFQLIWGERRVRASRLVGLETIKAEVVSATDKEMKKWAILENRNRKDTNPIENAKSTQILRSTGMGWKEISKSIGKRITDLQAELTLLELPMEVQEQVAKGHIARNVGIAIAGLPKKLHMEAFRKTNGRTLKYQMNIIEVLRTQSQNILMFPLTEAESAKVEQIKTDWNVFRKQAYAMMAMMESEKRLLLEVTANVSDKFFVETLIKSLQQWNNEVIGTIVAKELKEAK